MRILYVKPDMAWPRSSGHDVHSYYTMLALARLGHAVSLATDVEPRPEALAGLPLVNRWVLDKIDCGGNGAYPLRLTRLQERFRSYWGVSHARARGVAHAAKVDQADVVVVDGLQVLPYLGAVEGARRVWFAADEWVWHHLSQVRVTDRRSWGNVRAAAVKGLYERAYGPLLDRVWVVSEADRRAMNWIAGIKAVDVLPNGVDGDHYSPREGPQLEQSCVFWGRLDFGPNVQALQWFCRKVWPAVRRAAPGARFAIFGFKPTAPVQELAGRDGISLTGDLPDIRAEVCRHQVVVLPFVSGGGVKSKLLEALSLGKAVLGTRRACNGLFGARPLPLVQVSGARRWARALLGLWSDAERRRKLGADGRRWALGHHTWEATARTALAGLQPAGGGAGQP